MEKTNDEDYYDSEYAFHDIRKHIDQHFAAVVLNESAFNTTGDATFRVDNTICRGIDSPLYAESSIPHFGILHEACSDMLSLYIYIDNTAKGEETDTAEADLFTLPVNKEDFIQFLKRTIRILEQRPSKTKFQS